MGSSNASKKIRMTMACERCRCQQAKGERDMIPECSYDGSATQIDLFNLLKLNETVEQLQKRVESIETNMKVLCNDAQYVTSHVKMNQEANEKQKCCEALNKQETQSELSPPNTQWSLSLTPKGLRIDTNIISFQNLYDILLSGLSQMEIHDSTADSASSHSSSSTDTATILKKKPLWKSRLKTFPLYSSWEPNYPLATHTSYNYPLSKEVMDKMMHIYVACFLCLPCPEPTHSIAARYHSGMLDPLLANAVFAWTARHAAIFHNLFPGRDPNQVGEPFFLEAKSLIKERFTQTSIDTMHSLLIMYIYTIGTVCEDKAKVESEAYIYLGLAIRMCLDLKMNEESKSNDVYEQERHRRYFWSLYFLETLGTIHVDKPFSLPPKTAITVKFPTVMAHEEDGEIRYRVEFMIHRFKITRIYRDIIHKTAEEKPLLSHVSAIDKELKEWYAQLPNYFRYEPGDLKKRKWDTPSFREQGCIKLVSEYYFSLCQLYSLFFSKSPDEQSPIEVLSREICLKAAHTIVELLECWAQLKQDWCHFSLEGLAMVTMFYSNILAQPDDSENEVAKVNLEKIANLLISSPVRHHKHVFSLINHINNLFKELLNVQLDTIHLLSTSVPSQQPIDHRLNRRHRYNNNSAYIGNSNNNHLQPNLYSNNLHFSNVAYTPTVMDDRLLSSNVITFQTSSFSCCNQDVLPTGYNSNSGPTSSSPSLSSQELWMAQVDMEESHPFYDNNGSNSMFYQ
ncbi:hypothetical protein G6F43_003304 [Rhizopus delemar]|nr:hypothetical protein G6F43_003304 [Rhizopus delemar]